MNIIDSFTIFIKIMILFIRKTLILWIL